MGFPRGPRGAVLDPACCAVMTLGADECVSSSSPDFSVVLRGFPIFPCSGRNGWFLITQGNGRPLVEIS